MIDNLVKLKITFKKVKKYVVIVGGVLSGVGKGIATASIGKILTEYGFKTTAIKIDPYINYDAGTLRPTEHGEVWVTEDGGEIDQDLGSYERFLGIEISKKNNITTGQIYKAIIEKERRGEYLGETVQFIPHVPNEIIHRIKEVAKDYEITLIEIGGTVGDFENIPFLFAIKGMERNIGKENIIYVLITYLPVPHHIGEMKTKPTQQAIKLLQENGIIPDIILCRGRDSLDEVRRKKIEIYANIRKEYVISAPDIEIVYEVPINFEKEELGRKILEKLKLKPRRKPNWEEWEKYLNNIKTATEKVNIGIAGKYVEIGEYDLRDAYISINEALVHAGAKLKIQPKIEWIDTKKIEEKGVKLLEKLDGLIIPGGFGTTGVEGKIMSIKYARENGLPFLGLCFGMQLAVVEYARNVLGWKDAHTTEINKNTKFPVVTLLEEQKKLLKLSVYGGSMRLGGYVAYLKEGSLVYNIYKKYGKLEKKEKKGVEKFRKGTPSHDGWKEYVIERHRHRYEVSPVYLEELEKKGLLFSGIHYLKEGIKLPEFLELPDHPFFIATQSHPEFNSKFLSPAPLFIEFLKASKEYKERRKDDKKL